MSLSTNQDEDPLSMVDRGQHEHYRDAVLYDYEYRRRRKDVHFYTEFAKQHLASSAEPILELGCGSGRITRSLVRAGFPVLGLDLSQPMLVRARQRIAQLGRAARKRGLFRARRHATLCVRESLPTHRERIQFLRTSLHPSRLGILFAVGARPLATGRSVGLRRSESGPPLAGPRSDQAVGENAISAPSQQGVPNVLHQSYIRSRCHRSRSSVCTTAIRRRTAKRPYFSANASTSLPNWKRFWHGIASGCWNDSVISTFNRSPARPRARWSSVSQSKSGVIPTTQTSACVTLK